MNVRLTQHARSRAAEMEVRTKRVKQLAREHSISYGSPGDIHPLDYRIGYDAGGDIAVVFHDRVPDVRTVVTVLWHTQENYERPG